MDEDKLMKHMTIRCGRNSVVLFVFKTLKGFRDATNYVSNRKTNSRVACYLHDGNMPKTGRQGAVAISLTHLTEANLSHEFMHLAFKMRDKNSEEVSVLTASKMLAASLELLRENKLLIT